MCKFQPMRKKASSFGCREMPEIETTRIEFSKDLKPVYAKRTTQMLRSITTPTFTVGEMTMSFVDSGARYFIVRHHTELESIYE